MTQAEARRPARILFVLLHAGYLRHYGEPIRLLAARGQSVHVALARSEEKHAGDDLLLQHLVGSDPRITSSYAPVRSYNDPWRRIALFVRALIDLARYADPAYAHADTLRERIRDHTMDHVAQTRLPQKAQRVFLYLLDRLGAPTTRERAARRVRVLLTFEDAVPPSGPIVAFVREHQPDLVLATPVVEFASSQVEYLKAARALGIKTGVCVASWDNLTNKGLIRFQPNRVFVWNETQRDEAERFHQIPRNRVVATGASRYDPWFARTPSTTRETFMQERGLDPAQPYLLYLCSSPFIAPDEVSFVRRWLDSVRHADDDAVRTAGVLVRPHPQNARQWDGIELDSPNAVIWPQGGVHPDAGEAQAGYFDSMAWSAAVVGINTSALIEAGIAGKSVYTVLDPQFAGTQAGTLHFHYLLAENGGLLHTATDLRAHVEQLATALREPDADRARVQAFVESFVRPGGLDRPAADVLAEAIGEAALANEPSAGTTRPSARVIRLVLGSFAAASGLLLRPRRPLS
jgi:hypothetical protein